MATVTVKIPTPMRKFTGGAASVSASGASIKDVIADLESQHPGLQARLCDDQGGLLRFVNVYVNQDDVRFLDNLDTTLQDGDEIAVIPAIAGGL